MAIPSRAERLQALADTPDIPVLIIGGGANGIGTFYDLALQGVDVLLVEAKDYCGGASAASTHMAHGGIRYLENGEFRLVSEALIERNRLLRNAPHYVKPLPTMIPIYRLLSGLFNAPLKFLGLMDKPAERGAVVIKLGMIMYDWYARRLRVMPTHEFYGREEIHKRYPRLDPDVRFGAAYYDGFIPYPERICLELISEAMSAHAGARALNYVSAAGADGDTVTLRDEISGQTCEVRPQIVINAAGPWIDFANRAMQRDTEFIGGTKGSHLVIDKPELREAINEHTIYFENKDGRLVLLLPFFERLMAGTTDIRIDDPDDARCTPEETAYILGMLRKVFPGIDLSEDDIVFRFTGVRPLPASEKGFTGNVSRDHSIKVVEPDDTIHFPIYSLVGGKWTTFRAFSEQTADKTLNALGLSRQRSTADRSFGGGRDYPRDEAARQAWIERVASESGLPVTRITELFERYGTHAAVVADTIKGYEADQPLTGLASFSTGEIAHIAANEDVVHLDDVLLRRSLLAYRGLIDVARLAQIAQTVAGIKGWTDQERDAEIQRAKDMLAEYHGVML